MYRRKNDDCINCGTSGSVPRTTTISKEDMDTIYCKNCGAPLMSVVATQDNRASVPSRPAIDPPFNPNYEPAFQMPTSHASIEAWWFDDDYELVVNGVPVVRDIDDGFYKFREKILQRHSIYG